LIANTLSPSAYKFRQRANEFSLSANELSFGANKFSFKTAAHSAKEWNNKAEVFKTNRTVNALMAFIKFQRAVSYLYDEYIHMYETLSTLLVHMI
jgi:hypothetical protein